MYGCISFTNRQLIYYLKKNDFDFIGIGFMAARYKETVLPLCKVINKYKKNAKLVLGGHGPSAIPGYILSRTGADGLVVGEAEYIIHNVVQQIDRGRKILYGSPVKKLDSIPYPAWDLFPMDIYTNCINNPGMVPEDKMIGMVTSRGCVNDCTFCYRMEKGLRIRSLDNVIEEMKLLQDKYGITYFEFNDECFLLHKKRLEEFQQKLEENNMNIKYWCAARVDMVTEEVLKIMKDTGCKFINYGFESMDETVLKEMNKNVTPFDNLNAATLTRDAGIPFGVNMIWGYPSDNKNTLEDSVKFIKEFNSSFQCRTIRPVTPYPGSVLYDEAIEKGLLKDADDFFNRFNNSDLITVNFTKMKEDYMYEALFDANCRLIQDHKMKGGISSEESYKLMRGFQKLYFNKEYKFRGARKYEKRNIHSS